MLLTVEVDGQTFAVRRSLDGGTAYECVSDQSRDHGFATSESPDRPEVEHVAYLRESLRQVRS